MGFGKAMDSLSETSKRLLPWLIAVAFFMESLDTTILNTAVPTIAAALHVAPLNMKSVLASYTLSLAVFIPISGWMADRFGTRRVFASAIGIFALGSFLCGISRTAATFGSPSTLREPGEDYWSRAQDSIFHGMELRHSAAACS